MHINLQATQLKGAPEASIPDMYHESLMRVGPRVEVSIPGMYHESLMRVGPRVEASTRGSNTSKIFPAPEKDGLLHRKLAWAASCILIVLKLLERFALPWHWWPLWTGAGVVRLLLRRRLYETTNLVEVSMVRLLSLQS